MELLESTWFLSKPFDTEHKQYILLNFLQQINKDIEREDYYPAIKNVFDLINELKFARHLLEEKPQLPVKSIRQDQIWKQMNQEDYTVSDKKHILHIVNEALESLYGYVEIGSILWDNIRDKIKIFNFHKELEPSNSGILIIRNMSTDEIFCHLWSKTKISSQEAVIMKKIDLDNNYFSLSYEYIINEILAQTNGSTVKPKVTVMEILDDFCSESSILKIAKDLFVKDIEKNFELL
jgi:hypothetical protein